MKQFLTTFAGATAALLLAFTGYFVFNQSQTGRLDLERAPTSAEQQSYLAASRLADGLGTATDMKFLIYEFWAMEGRLPCSNDQLAFNANFENPVLRSVELTDCGEVTLHYRDNIGIEDGRMILQAVAGDGLTGVELQWDCWTPDFSGVEKFLPQCRFRKQPG